MVCGLAGAASAADCGVPVPVPVPAGVVCVPDLFATVSVGRVPRRAERVREPTVEPTGRAMHRLGSCFADHPAKVSDRRVCFFLAWFTFLSASGRPLFPAALRAARSCRPNPDGAIRTEPKWTIATKSRDQAAGVDNSPGPIYDLPPAAVERQVAGHKKSAPRPMFSRYSRWAKLEKELRSNTVPGPGHYG